MDRIKNKLFVLILLLLVLSLGASFVFAQKQLEIQYPQVPGVETPTTVKTPLTQYVKYIFNFGIWFAGFIAFVSLVYGGVRYLTSAGSAVVTSEAKKQILAGILGLIILLSSYVILNTVNPQLLFFSLSLPPVDEPPVVPPPPPLEEQTLYAAEIPLGELIDGVGGAVVGGSITSPAYTYEGVLAKTRLERIIKISEEIWDTSKKNQEVLKEIGDASQKLEDLVQKCTCASPSCKPVCGGCEFCPCTPSGDPCGSVRNEIRQQQTILKTKTTELVPLKEKLGNLVEKLKLEKEKLNNALVELEKAELAMKRCPSSVSEQSRTNVLLTSGAFWNYKEGLEKEEIIKKMEVKRGWEHISAENDEATFYCAETPFEVSLIEGVAEGDVTGNLTQVEGNQESRVFCEAPIPAGEVIDNSEDIAKRAVQEMTKMTAEMQKIIDEIPKEIDNASNIATLPNCSSCSQCRCSCSPIRTCCQTNIYGQCTYYCCISCQAPGSCQGEPCPEEKKEIKAINKLIQGNHQIITDAYNNITISDDEVHNLINGNEVHDATKKNDPPPNGIRKPTWAYNLINKELPGVRISFASCRNSAEDWAKSLSGETILTKNILTCDEGRDVCWDIEKDYKCYGENDANAYPDYFCAEAQLK